MRQFKLKECKCFLLKDDKEIHLDEETNKEDIKFEEDKEDGHEEKTCQENEQKLQIKVKVEEDNIGL